MTNDWNKGVFAPSEIEKKTPNVLRGDVSLPVAVIQLSRLEGNIRWMQAFADDASVKLAPHGKTTMCPKIFELQVEHGAWGMTLATAPQVAAAVKHGVRRILLANQLIGQRNMEIVADALGEASVYCIVDSIENVQSLGQFFSARGQELLVLIEIGTAQGRTGCRTSEEVEALNEVIMRTAGVRLSGIEVYEGILHGTDAEEAVHALLDRVISTTKSLAANDAMADQHFILTGAGSAWYDLVTARFLNDQLPSNVVPVIRPGSYVIHDTGMCDQFQDAVLERNSTANQIGGKLQSSLEIWTYIQSIPEDGLAIVTMGKRDVGFTDGLPLPSLHYRDTWASPRPADAGWEVVELMDQHTFMHIGDNADLDVGDMVSFSVSHPCLTCDKWRHFCVVDDTYNAIDIWPTFF